MKEKMLFINDRNELLIAMAIYKAVNWKWGGGGSTEHYIVFTGDAGYPRCISVTDGFLTQSNPKAFDGIDKITLTQLINAIAKHGIQL